MTGKSNQRIRAIKKRLIKQGALVAVAVMLAVILVFAMTTAWFTNVISVGDLTFKAESWGFDGSVIVPNDPIDAAPGDSGVVSLQVTNDGDAPSAITVNISKAFMDVELQKRVFFYAEKPAVINGELVQKQYLANAGGHTYQLFPHDELILNEQIHTDVQLKWEWVYDAVGFYFRGTPGETAFSVEEYLMPVKYDIDLAQYDEDGNLLWVNAQTHVTSFLCELTASDGYAGAFSTQTDAETGAVTLVDATGNAVQMKHKCYPIDPANNIWLYLCTKADIVANTKWDTEFGSAESDSSRVFQARITVVGQQLSQLSQQASDPVGLQNALDANTGSVVQLSQDIVLTQPLTVQSGMQAVLDLNGNQISFDGEPAFTVGSGAQLTVFNGSIKGSDAKTTAFTSVGGQITLSGVEVSDVYEAIRINDHTTANGTGDNSLIRITNSTLNSREITIMISGDGTASDGKTVLLVQNSTITSENYIGISGNGTATNPGRWGTDIQVIDSVVSGYYSGIYHPQMQSNLTISGSTVSGMTGLAIKGGNVTILDSKICGTGVDGDVVDPTTTTPSNSGYLDTGDGVYIESDYGYPITLVISGDCEITHTAATAKAVRVYPESNHVRTEISGGVFDSDITEHLANGYVCTESDGNYAVTVKE